MNIPRATNQRLGVVDESSGVVGDVAGLSSTRPHPRRQASDGGGGGGSSILPPSRRREEEDIDTSGIAKDDVKMSPPIMRSPDMKKRSVHVNNGHPTGEVGTPTSSPKRVKTKKKSSSKSPKRKSTKQSNGNEATITTIKEDNHIPTHISSSKKSPKKSPKKNKSMTADNSTDQNKEEAVGLERNSSPKSKKKNTEKSPKRKSKKSPHRPPLSKSPHKKEEGESSSSIQLPMVPDLDQDRKYQGKGNKTSAPPPPPPDAAAADSSSPLDKEKPSTSLDSNIASPVMSPGRRKVRKSMGTIDSPNNVSSPKLVDVDGTSFRKGSKQPSMVEAEPSCPQLMVDDDDDDKKPPASPKRKKKRVKNGDDDNHDVVVGEESFAEIYDDDDDVKSPKIKKKKKKQSTATNAAVATGTVPLVASMPNESRVNGVDEEDDKRQKRRSAATATSTGSSVNPGAVAVRGVNPHDDYEPSSDEEDAPPKKKKKKKKQSRLELAAGTEERDDVAAVSSAAQQQSRSDGPKPVPGSEYLDNGAVSTTSGRKPTNGDVEEGLVSNRADNPIEAHLVDDEDTVADRIAQRVKAQMEAQFKQQRQEEEARRVTVTAVKVDESTPEAASASAQQDGEEGNNKDYAECCFGLSRIAVISIVGVLLALVVVVSVVAAVLAPGPEPTASPTLSPTEEPTAAPTIWLEVVGVSKRFKSLLSLLEPTINPESLSPLEFLQGEDSPQFKAIEWMADEDSSGIPFANDAIMNTLVERYALMVLYFNSGQGSSDLLDLGFKSSSPVCSWHDDDIINGIECQSDSRVSSVWLPNFDLLNSVPSELGLLTALEDLNFDGNYFSSSLPTEIFRLSNLGVMWFWDSGLIGKIPSGIGSLTNLWSLDLSDNALTGPVPSELGSISVLYEILLWRNSLNGTLPTQLGNLAELKTLMLDENQIEGEFPTEFGLMESLVDLRLNDNTLSGMVPSELGNLYLLEVLWLQRNADLRGVIPSELGMLFQLTNLGFQDTGLTGDVDPIFCDAAQMNSWDVFYADCHVLSQKVVCSCCTHCCNNAGCVANGDDGEAGNECPDPPEATPIDLDPAGVAIFGSTIGAIVNMPTDSTFCEVGLGGSPTRWYVFETDATSTVTMTTCSTATTFDTVLGIFQFDCGNNICIASNDDYEGDAVDRCPPDSVHSHVSFNAQAFETYYIAISGYDSGSTGEFELFIEPSVYNGGQDIIHLITGTWSGNVGACAMEGFDGTRFDLGPVSLLLWVCPSSGVIGASLHGGIDDEGNYDRSFLFLGPAVEKGDDYVLYDVSLTDLDTDDEEFEGFTFNVLYQGGNLLVSYGGDECEVPMIPDDYPDIGTLYDFC